jgi:hypothetical protein
MAIDQGLANILDEAIMALSDFNLAKLLALEQRIAAVSQGNVEYERDGIGLILSKKRQLEILLQNCQTNLDVLTHLHVRNLRNQWAQ